MTTRRMMVAIALVGICLYAGRAMFYANTAYAPGYREGRFGQIRVGMTSEEVRALMGRPLRAIPWPAQGVVIWTYSEKRRASGNYWKRDVWLKDGKVVNVLKLYWVD